MYLFVILLSLGIHREPAFLYAVVLLEDFKDTPEARKGDDAENDARVVVLDEERGRERGDAGQ